MRVIGLTGGIGAGKNAVAEFLRQRGAVIIDADEIARNLTVPGSPLLAQVAQEFGYYILRPDGALDRTALANIVFTDPPKRQRLEAILHPPILAEAARRVEALRNSPHPPSTTVIMAPLLYEAHAEDMVEKVIVVVADEATRLRRLQARDRLPESAIRARFAAQMSQEEKARRADWVIDNSGSLKETEKQVEEVWEKLLEDIG